MKGVVGREWENEERSVKEIVSDNSDLLTNFRSCCKAESTSRGFQKGGHRHAFSVFVFRH